jgi:hypothetical protein
MNGNYKKFLACMKALRRVPVNTFQNRMICKNVAYLLQSIGVKLGYDDWTFMVRGVYSVKFMEDNLTYLKQKEVGKDG